MPLDEPINRQLSHPARRSYPAWVGKFLGLIDSSFTPFAGPYRAIAYKPGSGEGGGLLTWAGALVVFPAFAAISLPFGATLLDGFLWAWSLLVAAVFLQMMIQRRSHLPGREVEPGGSWAGPGEFLLAVALFIAGEFHCGPGVGSFFALGYAASMAQIHLGRARQRCESSTPEVAGKVVQPLRGWVKRESESFRGYAGRARDAATSFVRLTSRTCMAARALSTLSFGLGTSGLAVAWVFLKAYRRKRAEAAALRIPHAPTFLNRVGGYIVAHFVISGITGIIGLGSIFKFFALILAIPLWLIGGKIEPPEEQQHDGRAIFSRASEVFDREREKATETLRREGSRAKEEAAAKLKKVGDKVEEAAEAAGEKASRSFWRSLSPW